MQALTHLDLQNNSLKALPQDIFASLPKLQTLELAENKFRELSPSISNLKGLLLLNLQNNPELVSLPDELFSLGNTLTHLYLSRCPKVFATTSNEKGGDQNR